jgi:hypothetical protein
MLSRDEPAKCGTCGKVIEVGQPRYREPGFPKGDVDCDQCWQTWGARALAAIDAKATGGVKRNGNHD